MLRTVGPDLDEVDRGFVVQAQAMSEWHRSHRFCPRCGGGLGVSGGGYVLTCESCERHHFPRTDPAVIMLVSDGDRALLGRQPVWPAGRYSTLAGFVDPGESLEEAVIREVMEEAGVEVTDVTYFGNQPWPFPSSLMVGFFARAVTTEVARRRRRAGGGTVVLPRPDARGGGGGHAAAAGRDLDQPFARSRRGTAGACPASGETGAEDQEASSSAASFALTSRIDGLVCAELSE